MIQGLFISILTVGLFLFPVTDLESSVSTFPISLKLHPPIALSMSSGMFLHLNKCIAPMRKDTMKFKKIYMKAQLEKHTHSFLLMVAKDFEYLSYTVAGVEPVVTRVVDKVNGESGVHPDGRGLDFRDEYAPMTFLYNRKDADKICAIINKKYQRTDGKKTILHHRFKPKSPLHFHLQVSLNAGIYKQ